MKKSVINLSLGFAVMLFLSFNGSVAYAQTAQTVTSLSCGTNVFAPYGFEENGEIKGIEVEILQEIGKRTNIKIDLKL
jgi:ABC-type amino acid transport substrate-binding protein